MPLPYRADQIGSLLRPAELLHARSQADPERLRALEDKHILHILNKQKELGFDVFTEGELRRRNFMSDFTDAVEGFDMGEATPRSWASTGSSAAAAAAPAPTGKNEDADVSRVAGIVTAKLRQV